jgi:hypothetical protein
MPDVRRIATAKRVGTCLPGRDWLTKRIAKIYRVSFQHTVLSNATQAGKDLLSPVREIASNLKALILPWICPFDPATVLQRLLYLAPVHPGAIFFSLPGQSRGHATEEEPEQGW